MRVDQYGNVISEDDDYCPNVMPFLRMKIMNGVRIVGNL